LPTHHNIWTQARYNRRYVSYTCTQAIFIRQYALHSI
jgi:hypothetical protein